jgi:hypothetical protein
VFQNIAQDLKINRVISMHENVAKTNHPAERHRERRLDPAVPFEEVEQLTVRPRLAEVQVRDDVRGNIEGGLNGDLQRVLDDRCSRRSFAISGGRASRRRPRIPATRDTGDECRAFRRAAGVKAKARRGRAFLRPGSTGRNSSVAGVHGNVIWIALPV